MASTMSWRGPHAVAGRVWVVFDAVRTPDGLNDITAFDVWLAE